MIDKKPKLQLKKRTIANLSNIEMRHVYGGGGDDEGGDISRNACGTTNDKDVEEIMKEAARIALSKIVLVC